MPALASPLNCCQLRWTSSIDCEGTDETPGGAALGVLLESVLPGGGGDEAAPATDSDGAAAAVSLPSTAAIPADSTVLAFSDAFIKSGFPVLTSADAAGFKSSTGRPVILESRISMGLFATGCGPDAASLLQLQPIL